MFMKVLSGTYFMLAKRLTISLVLFQSYTTGSTRSSRRSAQAYPPLKRICIGQALPGYYPNFAHGYVSSPAFTSSNPPSKLLFIVACAIHAQRYAICVEQSRKIITSYQFNNEPFRLLVASLSAGLRPTDSFITSPLQKAIFREVKMADAAVTKPETLKWMPMTKRYSIFAPSKGEEEEEEEDPDDDAAGDAGGGGEKLGEDNTNKREFPELPAKQNPVVVGVYGQICIAAKSYQSAICEQNLVSLVFYGFTEQVFLALA